MSYTLNKIYSDFNHVHQVCREVLSVSDKAGIQAVLIGGSLLGMVRDGDFLPWDKDLDFAVFETDIQKTLALESQYRDLGYECRVHHLGIRNKAQLQQGQSLIIKLSATLQQKNINHCLIGGGLLNLYRDGQLFAETDTLAFLLESPDNIELLSALLAKFGQVFLNKENNKLKGITLVTEFWRVNFFIQVKSQGRYGWLDLNCEHWFQKAFFPAQSLELEQGAIAIPNNAEDFLSSRYGKNWQKSPSRKFSQGRVVGSMQLYKDGVMFDFIMHYVRGDKTYWFEPAANVISTKGFLPCSLHNTTAGKILLPDFPGIFLQEHYGNWKTPVKTWNGAVDNPTIIDGQIAMDIINNHKGT